MHKPKRKSTDDTITQYKTEYEYRFANNGKTHKMFGKMIWAANEMQYAHMSNNKK